MKNTVCESCSVKTLLYLHCCCSFTSTYMFSPLSYIIHMSRDWPCSIMWRQGKPSLGGGALHKSTCVPTVTLADHFHSTRAGCVRQLSAEVVGFHFGEQVNLGGPMKTCVVEEIWCIQYPASCLMIVIMGLVKVYLIYCTEKRFMHHRHRGFSWTLSRGSWLLSLHNSTAF